MTEYKPPQIFGYEHGPIARISMFQFRSMNPPELMGTLRQAYQADDSALIVRKGNVIVPSRIGRDASIEGRVLQPTEICTGGPLEDTLHLELGHFKFNPNGQNFVISSNGQLYAGEDPTALDMISGEHPHPVFLGYLRADLRGKSAKFLSYFDNSEAFRDYQRESRPPNRRDRGGWRKYGTSLDPPKNPGGVNMGDALFVALKRKEEEGH